MELIPQYLVRQKPIVIFLVGILLMLIVTTIDYFTGPDMGFSIFYLVPVALVSWSLPASWGVVISLLCTFCWSYAEDYANKIDYHPISINDPLLPIWNGMIGLGIFLTMSLALSAFHASKKRQERLTHYIVHDLRSPMTNIITGMQSLEMMADCPLNADQKEVVEMGLIAGNRMLTMINSLLDTSRMAGRQMPLQQQELSAREIAAEAITQVDMWARYQHIEIRNGIAAELPEVIVDRELIVRVIVNLLSNAIKFSPADSQIIISAATVGNKMLKIRVADEGPGIEKKWAREIFKMYTQVEGRTDSAPSGSGLGLTFCRLAVEAHRGKIWVESEVGKGTTMVFTLPLK